MKGFCELYALFGVLLDLFPMEPNLMALKLKQLTEKTV